MSKTIPHGRAAAVAILLALASCNASPPPPEVYAPPPPGRANGVTPPGFRLPEGAGCSGDVARWQAIQGNDLQAGHVSQSVYNQIQGEIAQASAVCQAGRDAEASAMVRASKARHGYPG